MRLREELSEQKSKWSALNFYQKFEQAVLYVLTALIAVVITAATWQLVLTTVVLVSANLLNPADYSMFQAVFGMIFTVMIALEFKHSLLVVLHKPSLIQVKSVILIAILALVRKFIIVDVHTTSAGMIAALAAAILALGVVYILIREH